MAGAPRAQRGRRVCSEEKALDGAQRNPGNPLSNFWRQIVLKTSEATKSAVNTRFARVNGSDEDADGPASNACSSLGHVASPPEPQRRGFVRSSKENGMPKFNEDIKKMAKENTDFRREILTNEHSQIVLMSIEPGDEIGEESHEVDQVLVFVKGKGEAVLDGERRPIRKSSLVAVPAGTLHNFINTGDKPLKLFTIYSPPEEAPGTVHRNKAEALAAEQQR
jgi:mannose-6-phosphate isomerase-like protein (cupin superfamily)